MLCDGRGFDVRDDWAVAFVGGGFFVGWVGFGSCVGCVDFVG